MTVQSEEPEMQMVSAGNQMSPQSMRSGKVLISHGQQMSEHSEKVNLDKINYHSRMVSHGQQMTEQSEKVLEDNTNYNSRKNFLRGEATMEPIATDSNVNQT